MIFNYMETEVKSFLEFIAEAKKQVAHPDIPEENQGGDCYIVGYNYFMKNHSSNPNLRLCHGLVTGQGKIAGIKYNHCWVEDVKTETVYDMTMPEFFQNVNTNVYYYMGKINPNDVFKYDFDEVIKKADEEQTYGPWEDKLKQNKY